MRGYGAKFNVAESQTLTLAWDVGGWGTMTKRGEGELVLSGRWNYAEGSDHRPKLAVESGAVTLAEGFENGSYNTITMAAGTAIAAAAGDAVAVAALIVGEGGFVVKYDAASQSAGVLTLDSTCAMDATKSIPVTAGTDLPIGEKVAFLRIPVSVREVTEADFEVAADSSTLGLGSVVVEVDVADDIQTISVRRLPILTDSGNPASSGKFEGDNASCWSDTLAFHSGADYLVTASSASKTVSMTDSTADPETVLTFAGHALGLVGATKSILSIFQWREQELTGDFRFGDFTRITLTPDANSETAYKLKGKIAVANSKYALHSQGLDLQIIHSCHTVTVESVVSGSGGIMLEPNASAATLADKCGTAILSETNTYQGAMRVWAGGGGRRATIRFRDECNLGINPTSFLEQGFYLSEGSEVHPIGSVMIDDANRGICFNSAVAIRVDEDESLTMLSPSLFWASAITKTGSGVWRLGGSVTLKSGAAASSVMVSEGYLGFVAGTEFADIPITLAGGGIAAIVPAEGGVVMAANGLTVLAADGLTVSGKTIPVMIDATAVSRVKSGTAVPFLTVSGATATVLADKEFVFASRGNLNVRHLSVQREDVTVDEVACVRYSAVFTRGFSVNFR